MALLGRTPVINKFNCMTAPGLDLFDSSDEVACDLQTLVRQLAYGFQVRRPGHKSSVAVKCRGLGPRSIDRQNCPVLVQQSGLLSQTVGDLLPHFDKRGWLVGCNVG